MAKIIAKVSSWLPICLTGGKTQMISSVSSASAVSRQAVQNQQAARAPAKPKDTQKPDTVALSKQAQAAGDVDHDGDSH